MKVRLIASLIGAAVAAAAVLAGSQLVSAHSRPILFDPPAGAVLDAAPAQITGWFTSELRNDPNWNFLRVTDQNGARVDTGEVALSSDRYQMTVPLKTGLSAGRYTVTWRTWDDADGEIFGDCYVFYVGQEAADKAVVDKFRLDAGSTCERVEVNARTGTPVPGATPESGDDHGDDGGTTGGGNSDDNGVPAWTLIAGVGIGAAVGLVGGRFLMGSK